MSGFDWFNCASLNVDSCIIFASSPQDPRTHPIGWQAFSKLMGQAEYEGNGKGKPEVVYGKPSMALAEPGLCCLTASLFVFIDGMARHVTGQTSKL